MKLKNRSADVLIPDGSDPAVALRRTTHLAVGAHQDDLEIMAFHGILQCFDAEQRWFTGVTCTNGSGSPRGGPYARFTDAAMCAVRRAEQRQAASVGRYSAMLQLDHASTAVKQPGPPDLLHDLRLIFGCMAPQIVYTHNLCDKHDTHVAVAAAVLQTLRELPRQQRPTQVYGCEVWRDLDWLADEDKIALDIGGRENLAAALLGVYDSQIAGGKRYDLGTLGRRRANATYCMSHGLDAAAELTFAMDLTPLVQDESLDPADFVRRHIACFAADVAEKLKNLGL